MTGLNSVPPGEELSQGRETRIERLVQALWRPRRNGDPAEVYLILDAARDRRIWSILRRPKVDSYCLLLGNIHPRLARAAPYILHLGRRSPFSRSLIEQAWGNNWGVFVVSPVILQDLRRHFRKIFNVRDEVGKRYFFRFYDPRVLRVYLPTCTQQELRQVFGPVERFHMESEGADRLLEFDFDRKEMTQRSVLVPPDPADAQARA